MNVQSVKVAGALFKCSVTLPISAHRFVSDREECAPREVAHTHKQLSNPLHVRSPCGLPFKPHTNPGPLPFLLNCWGLHLNYFFHRQKLDFIFHPT